MPFPALPDPIADHEREAARWRPERETLALAAAGAAKVVKLHAFLEQPPPVVQPRFL